MPGLNMTTLTHERPRRTRSNAAVSGPSRQGFGPLTHTSMFFFKTERVDFASGTGERRLGPRPSHTSLSREAFAFPPRWRADAQECHTPSIVFGPDASGRKMQNPWL